MCEAVTYIQKISRIMRGHSSLYWKRTAGPVNEQPYLATDSIVSSWAVLFSNGQQC